MSVSSEKAKRYEIFQEDCSFSSAVLSIQMCLIIFTHFECVSYRMMKQSIQNFN